MNPPNDTKEIFRHCGACSQTFAHLLNRRYGHRDSFHEKALYPLAGGIFREGHQCGMIWGAALATGAEAFRRAENLHEAEAMALSAAKELVASFEDREHTIECKEITGVEMNRFFGLLKFMVKSMWKGMDKNPCFVLAENWTPEAITAAEVGLNKHREGDAPAYNCAALTVKNMGGTDEEAAMVAGFAGGIGLSGKGCGALAAGIWMITMDWLRKNPDATPPMFRFPEVSQLIEGFKEQTGGKMRCEEICGRKFDSAEEHSDFLENGGCRSLLSWLSQRA
jgi:hypothetical protein